MPSSSSLFVSIVMMEMSGDACAGPADPRLQTPIKRSQLHELKQTEPPQETSHNEGQQTNKADE